MAKNNKNTRPRAVSTQNESVVSKKLDQIEEDVESSGIRDELPSTPDEPLRDDDLRAANVARLESLWTEVKRMKDFAEKNQVKLEDSSNKLREQQLALEDEQVKLRNAQESLLAERKDIEEMRDQSLRGFYEERLEIIKAAEEYRNQRFTDGDDYMAGRLRKFADEKEQLTSEITRTQEKIRQKEADLAKREAEVQLEHVKAERTLERRIEVLNGELEGERQRVIDLQDDLAEAKDQLLAQSINIKKFGVEPKLAARRIKELELAIEELSNHLDQMPTEAEIARLHKKAQLVDVLQGEAEELRRSAAALELRSTLQTVSVTELQTYRDINTTLSEERNALRDELNRQKADWVALQGKTGSTRPFPACSSYDVNPVWNLPTSSRKVANLRDLADEIRNRMAQAAPPFYYSAQDVRLFLAGMASSRLHILQGISGTGKTSLPREFFTALSGSNSYEVIEVQAGWRDQDDLFGFYNAFEKRFVESEFTQALYRAMLPANSDRALVVILDEMNLSHPEQYFGTMLSALESSVDTDGAISLLSIPDLDYPARIKNGKLPLSKNVWFVGTANHDETTVAFADKTYDRAHVQELPTRRPEFFEAKGVREDDPISFKHLMELFQDAETEYRVTVDNVKEVLNGSLRASFEKLGIGWGNRLDRQVGSFVSVVLAAGGSASEALDHIIDTKLLRKIVDKFGLRPETLLALEDDILRAWHQLAESDAQPEKSIKKLGDAIKRLNFEG